MKALFKYPFTAIITAILIIGLPFTVGYLYKESHKSNHTSKIAITTPTATPTKAPSSTPEPAAGSEPAPDPEKPSNSNVPVGGQDDMDPDNTAILPSYNPSKSHSFVTVSNEYFDDALFIGDSRTVGLSEYAPYKGATYFATVGMSAHNVMSTKVSIPSMGKLTLTQLLKSRSFGKVYIMLGINELGYKFDSIISKYRELLKTITEMQPDAIIYIQANLHVTKAKSDEDNIINNKSIDILNESLSELADWEKIFYIDVNEVFDDGNGNLDSCYTSDNAHILGKYYAQWGQWLCTKAIQK